MTLEDALEALEGSALARELLGQDFIEHYLVMKRFEVDKYWQQVSEWEVRRYLELAWCAGPATTCRSTGHRQEVWIRSRGQLRKVDEVVTHHSCGDRAARRAGADGLWRADPDAQEGEEHRCGSRHEECS